MLQGLTTYVVVIAAAIGLLSIVHSAHSGTGEQAIPRPFVPAALAGVSILALFQGTRYYVGSDYRIYAELYSVTGDQSLRESIASIPQEPAFTTLSFLAKQTGLSFQGFTLLLSGLTLGAVILGLSLLRVNLAVGVTLYCLLGLYPQGFNIMRQSLAVALVLLAYALWTRAGWLSKLASGLVALTAFGTHATALIPVGFLVVLAMPLLARVLVGVGACVVAALAGVDRTLLFLTSGSVGDRYVNYLEGSDFSLGKVGLLGVYAIAFLLAFRVRELLAENASAQNELRMLGAGVVIVALSLGTPYLERAAFFFIAFGCVYFSRLSDLHPSVQRDRQSRNVCLQVIYLVGTANLLVSVGRYSDLIPYSSWLL